MTSTKPLALKPQDLVVALKLCANAQQDFTLQGLSLELGLALSVVHGCVARCESATLVSRWSGALKSNRSALREFTIHGAKYAFPAVLGPLTRGIPTAVAGPVLALQFEHGKALSPVWPDAAGHEYGPAVTPLHSCVPDACKRDPHLYEILSLLDALRVGAAREQELAKKELEERLQ